MTKEFLDALLGLTEVAAEDRIARAGFDSRTLERDGVKFAGIMNYDPTRVNLTIVDGIVTKVKPG